MNKKTSNIVGGVGLLLIVMGLTLTYGKYISNTIWEYYLISQGFYFSSNYLNTNNPTIVDNDWDEDVIFVDVKNHENESLIATGDIEYTLECNVVSPNSESLTCVIDEEEKSMITSKVIGEEVCINETEDQVIVSSYEKSKCLEEEYTWIKLPVINTHYFIVKPEPGFVYEDVEVEVKLTSTKPFVKKLLGRFVLHKNNIEENTISKRLINDGDKRTLIVTNSYLENKCITLGFNPALFTVVSDLTHFSKITTNAQDIVNKVSFLIPEQSSFKIEFSPLDKEATYTQNNFTASEDSVC